MSDSSDVLTIEQVDDVCVARFNSKSPGIAEIEPVINRLLDLAESGQTKVLLNLGEVEYLPSTALGELVRLHIKLGDVGGGLRLCHLQHSTSELFEITGLDSVVPIDHDEQSGLKSF